MKIPERPMTEAEKAEWQKQHADKQAWLDEQEAKKREMPAADVPDDDETTPLFGEEHR